MDVKIDTPDKPDAGDIALEELTPRPTASLADVNDFSVVVARSAWDQMNQHAHVRLDVEVGGVLVGHTCLSQTGAPYLLIEAIIPAVAAESRETNITFTAEAWTRIHETIDRDHPDGMIVGWYHTHPSFGIFLSEMDIFICRHFFDLPHQVAIVIDPVAKIHGCFIWRSGVPADGTMVIEDSTTIPSAAEPVPTPARTRAIPPATPRAPRRRSIVRRVIGKLIDSLTRLEGSQWLALLFLLVLGLLVFGALAMLWFHLSPADLFERLRSLTQHPKTGGAL